jgi:hypothetical protein
LFSAQAGAAVSKGYNIPESLSIAISGTLMIILATLIAGFFGYFIKRHRLAGLTDEEEKKEYLLNDNEFGSWLGLVQGLLLSCFAALMLSLLPSENKVAVYLELKDSAFVDFMAPLAPTIVDSVMTGMLGNTSNAKIAAAVLSNPQKAQDAAKEIIKSDAMGELIKSEDFTRMLESGTVEEIAANQQIQNVLKDPKVLAAFGKLGISESDLKLSPEDMSKIVDGYRNFMTQMNQIKGTDPGGTITSGSPGQGPSDLLNDPEMIPKLMQMLTSMASGNSLDSGKLK